MDLIPDELKEIKQWTYSFSKDELKRPRHHKYIPNGGLDFNSALEKAGNDLYIGFYATPTDPYVLMDIDHVDNPDDPFAELPVALAAFIQQNNTYSEKSPSGQGLRLIYKLPAPEDKALCDGFVFYITEGMDSKKQAQINFGPPWQTITRNATPYAFDTVGTVTLNDLAEIFTVRLKDRPTEKPKQEFDRTKLPKLAEVSTALMSIPLDQNPRVQRAYEKVFHQAYAHYDFWIRLLMALHHYSSLADKNIECLELALQWSRTDPAEFESDEDVQKHWRSFNDAAEREITSYRTLFGVAYKYRLFWPMPKKRTKAEKDANIRHRPLVSEYSNFEALLKYYDVRLFRDHNDPNILYVSADQDVIDKYFIMFRVESYYGKYYGPFVRDTLIPAFHIWCQDHQFTGITHNQVMQFVKNTLAKTRKTVDLIKMYFDTPYEQLPEEYRHDSAYYESTTFDKLFSCLRIDFMTKDQERELDLYKAYYKKWLMGIIRNLYYRDQEQMNNCVLLLTGKEQIRKTSHFKYMFPPFMRDKVAFTTHGFATETAMRDVVKLSATNLVLVWDELEQFLVTGTESNFKKIIDGNPQKIIDKYETIEKMIIPIAAYGATSNLREFKLGSEGSRRIFHIPVEWVDTDKMQEICWHKLFNDLRDEIDWMLKTGHTPWLLTKEQLDYQMHLHGGLRAKNSIDMMLEEIYNFDEPVEWNGLRKTLPGVTSLQTDKTGRLMSTKEVSDILVKAGVASHNIKRPALVKSLERLCGAYTDTRHRKIDLARPLCTIHKGQAVQKQYKRWVMPPMREGAIVDMFSQFKNLT